MTANNIPFTRAEEMLFEFEEATDYKPYTLDPIRTFMPIVEKQKGANSLLVYVMVSKFF